MIREINNSIDESGNSGLVQITDESGERFLKGAVKDTAITIDRRREIPSTSPVVPSMPVVDITSLPVFTRAPSKVVNIRDLGNQDTIHAVLSNGEQVRLTFDNRREHKPNKKWKKDYRTSRLNHNFFAVDFGLNNWLQDGTLPGGEDKLYTIKPVGSWYVGGRYFRRFAIGGSLFLDFGGSATWYNWKFENKNVRINKNTDDVEFIEDFEIEGIKSKLSASYLNLEIIPMFDFSYGKVRIDDPGVKRNRYTKHKRRNGLRIGVGGYAGYRLDSWTKNVYTDANGEEKKDKEHSTFFLNDIRYGVRAQVELDHEVSIFCNYDLNTVFIQDKGPKLNAVSFGIACEL